MSSFDYIGPSVHGYETDSLKRVAAISVHTSPLATLGSASAGGMNVYIRELSCHIARLGLPVDIFTRRTNPESPQVMPICEGVNVVSLDVGPIAEYDKNGLFDLVPEFARAMVDYAAGNELSYDVVHAHYWLSGWTAQMLKRYWRTPYVLMFHTTAHMKNAVSPIEQHETQLRAATERQLVQLADSIIAANPDEERDLIVLQKGNANKICTIPPGVDTEMFYPLDRAESRRELCLSDDQQVLVFIGRIDPIKGIDVLLGTIGELKQRGEQVTLLLVGGELDDQGMPEGPLAAVATQAESLGISDFIRYEGSIPQFRLPVYYSAADVTLVTSRYESFGLVAVESMGCRTPVVASNVGGLKYTVDDGYNGFLASATIPSEFADGIQKILHDPALAIMLAAGCRETAERFSWPNVAEAVMQIYEGLADGRREHLCLGTSIYV